MTKSIFYCRNGSVSIFIHWPEFCGTLSYLMAAQTYIHPRFIPRFSILCFEICIICENSCIKWRRAWSSSCQTSHWNSALLCLTLLVFPHSDSTLGILELPWGSPLLAQHFQGEGKLKGRWMRTPVQEFPREETRGEQVLPVLVEGISNTIPPDSFLHRPSEALPFLLEKKCCGITSLIDMNM